MKTEHDAIYEVALDLARKSVSKIEKDSLELTQSNYRDLYRRHGASHHVVAVLEAISERLKEI